MYIHRSLGMSARVCLPWLCMSEDLQVGTSANRTLDHVPTVTILARDFKGDVNYQYRVVCDSLKGKTEKVIPCLI